MKTHSLQHMLFAVTKLELKIEHFSSLGKKLFETL